MASGLFRRANLGLFRLVVHVFPQQHPPRRATDEATQADRPVAPWHRVRTWSIDAALVPLSCVIARSLCEKQAVRSGASLTRRRGTTRSQGLAHLSSTPRGTHAWTSAPRARRDPNSPVVLRALRRSTDCEAGRDHEEDVRRGARRRRPCGHMAMSFPSNERRRTWAASRCRCSTTNISTTASTRPPAYVFRGLIRTWNHMGAFEMP